MNLEEVKSRFPESVSDIQTLERLGLASRSTNWIHRLDSEMAQTACWLIGRIGDEQDADALVGILSGHRRELWMQAAASLALLATERHLIALLTILKTSSDPAQRESVLYTLSFLTACEATSEVIGALTEVAANRAEIASTRSQALEGLGNQLSFRDEASNLYQKAVALILEALDDAEAEVRFWACFAAGAIKIEEALPKLQLIAETDSTIVPGWWSVAEEAEDAIACLQGEEPPLRERCNSPST